MADKPIYCGSGRKKNDKWLQITINPDKLKGHVQEFNGNRFIKLNINVKDQPDQYGKDVSVSVDTWKPENKEPEYAHPEVQRQYEESKRVKSNIAPSPEDDTLPF